MSNLNLTAEFERSILGAVMAHGFEPIRTVRLLPADFTVPAHAKTLLWLDRHRDKRIVGNIDTIRAALEGAGLTKELGSEHGAAFELWSAGEGIAASGLAELAAQLVQGAIDRRRREAAGRFERGEMTAEEFAEAMRGLDARAENLDARAAAVRIDEVIDARRFDHCNPPPEPPALFSIGGAKISTPGNITNIASQAKAGNPPCSAGCWPPPSIPRPTKPPALDSAPRIPRAAP